MTSEKNKSTDLKPNNLKWTFSLVIVILIIISIFFFIQKENTREIQPTQKTTSDNIHLSLASSKKSITASQATNSIQNEIKTLYSLDKINQSILYTRISYLEITVQQNIQTATKWLNLSFDLIKEAKIGNTNIILEEIAKLKEALKQQQQPDTHKTQQKLDEFKNTLDHMGPPNSQPKKAENAGHVESNENEETKTLWESMTKLLTDQIKKIQNWIQSSITIEQISTDQYQTLNNTISKEFFQIETRKLIEQAELAANFHDSKTFNYTCQKLSSLIKFYVHDSKQRQSLLKNIDEISKMPVSIKVPDYSTLLTLLNQLDTEKSDFKNQEHDAKSSYDMKKTMNSDPKEKTPAADIPTKEIPNKKPQKQQRQVFNQIFHETTT